MHEEIIKEYATTENEATAREHLVILVAYFLALYDAEKEDFASNNDVDTRETYDPTREQYMYYITDLLIGMRERCLAKKEELRAKQETVAILLGVYVLKQYQRIKETETVNATQLAQLTVAENVKQTKPTAQIYKVWRAHSGACDACKAMDGTRILIDEPFLLNGQTIPLANGDEFIYNYIDRGVAILHPNDKCYVEFEIEY